MSEQIRNLQGRIEIVFGKEEQDNGVSVFASNNPNANEIDSAVKKALLSLNSMSLAEPIFRLDSMELFRGARLIGKKQLYINTIGNDGVTLRYSFVRPRGIVHWTIAGVEYDYKKYKRNDISETLKKEEDGAYAIEIPCEIELDLYTDQEQLPVRTIRFLLLTSNTVSIDEDGNPINVNVANGLYFKRTELVSTGDNQVQATNEVVLKNPFMSQELRFELGTGYNEKFSAISVTIKKAHRVFVLNGEYIYFTQPIVSESSQYNYQDKFNAGELPQCWISKCYDNQTEIYDGNEIQNMEITRQLPNSEGDVNYGLVSNSFRAKILNENRKLDLGYLRDVSIMGKRVLPRIIVDGKEHILGTYFISEWDIPMDNSWVEFQATDRLTDLQSLMYNGFFPEKETENFYRIIDTVVESINENILIQLDNKIWYQTEALEQLRKFQGKLSSELYAKMENYVNSGGALIEGVDFEYLTMEIKSPYLERQSIWDVLDNIAKSTLSVIYIDEQDRLIFHSDMYDNCHFILDGQLYQYSIDGSYSKVGVNAKSADDTQQKVSSSNAFSLSKPKKRKAVVTEMSTSYYTYNFNEDFSGKEAENVITYYLKDLKPIYTDDDYRYYRIHIPKIMKNLDLFRDEGIDYVSSETEVVCNNNRQYYEVKVRKTTPLTSQSCTIVGNAISNSSTSITVRDFNLEDQNALDYSAGTLLNSVESANRLANRLIELYGKGRELFESEWVGDLSYDINCPMQFSFTLPIGAVDGELQEGKNCVVSNNISFDGSLRQTLKALSYHKI